MIDKLIGLALGVFVGVILIGAAIAAYAAQNTSGWDANTVAIWGVIGVVVVAVFALILYNEAK